MIATALLHAPVRLADAFARSARRMDLGDLSEYGLPVPEEGVFSRFRRLGVAPSIVDREVIETINHLGVLDKRGIPRAQGARAAAPGLRFIGYTSRPGALGYMSKQAKQAAKTIAHELRSR